MKKSAIKRKAKAYVKEKISRLAHQDSKMEYLSGVINNVSRFASNINPSTLSGSIDVVFVKQTDGRFKSTPFFIKFGKIGVIQAKEKIIYIEINGREIDKTMVLDDNGVAFFDDPAGHNQQAHVKQTDEEKIEIGHRRTDSSRRTRHMSEPSDTTPTTEPETLRVLSAASRALSNPNLEELEQEATVINELTLTQKELNEFNLQPGLNEAVFSVTTQYQGTTRCCCSIFVWDQTDRVIISDIDGTITKSDVRGMILPLIGLHDWAQEEVTQLYSKISQNGYKILYLSARSISQASATRDYLRGLQQGALKLPVGPLFLNPESVFRAFKKEVIDRQPEIFKISCLTRLRGLFVCDTPFFAGYGNRPNDIVAYQSVGIPRARIFIINKTGELKGSISHTQRTSYKTQSSIVDMYFPPLNQLVHLQDLQAHYWDNPHQLVQDNDI